MEDKERRIARELIRVREQGFPSPWTSVVGSKPAHWVRYLAIGVVALLLVTSWSDIGVRSFCLAALGVLIGAITKEMAMTKKSGDSWPFVQTVIDWQKVAKSANAESEQGGDGDA